MIDGDGSCSTHASRHETWYPRSWDFGPHCRRKELHSKSTGSRARMPSSFFWRLRASQSDLGRCISVAGVFGRDRPIVGRSGLSGIRCLNDLLRRLEPWRPACHRRHTPPLRPSSSGGNSGKPAIPSRTCAQLGIRSVQKTPTASRTPRLGITRCRSHRRRGHRVGCCCGSSRPGRQGGGYRSPENPCPPARRCYGLMQQ